jgi:hypothetical protein
LVNPDTNDQQRSGQIEGFPQSVGPLTGILDYIEDIPEVYAIGRPGRHFRTMKRVPTLGVNAGL